MHELTKRVTTVIAETIRPALQTTGGDIELIGIDQGIVQVRLTGTCDACPSTAMFLVMDIERQIRGQVPEVEYVEVTS
jgi:Fe-S cluster biogenesis protein NfuA